MNARNYRVRTTPRFAVLTLLVVMAPAAYAGSVITIASSEERASLLELFTSEGCSSCPPADAWLSRLKDDARLWRQWVPVAFHVDYWDYLGWRDPFAKAEFSDRQRQYQRSRAIKVVYTPGLVLDGREWRGWFDRQPLPEIAPRKVGVLTGHFGESAATVEFTSLQTKNPPLILHVAHLGSGMSTRVAAGENSGKTLKHDFTVLELHAFTQSAVGNRYSWRIESPAPAPGAAPRSRAVALWVTELNDSTPIQATGGWLQ